MPFPAMAESEPNAVLKLGTEPGEVWEMFRAKNPICDTIVRLLEPAIDKAFDEGDIISPEIAAAMGNTLLQREPSKEVRKLLSSKSS